MRGLAIIAVVCIHNTSSGLEQVWVRPFLNFSVGLFLFLSGLLSNAKNWNPGKRIIKVIRPYIIWTLVYVTIGNIKTPSCIPISYAKALLLANSAAVMYYVFVYCQFTLLIPLINKLAHSKVLYLGFLITPIEIILMRYIPLYTGFELNSYILKIQSFSCLGWFTYFYLGYLIGNKIFKINISTIKLEIMLALSIVLQIGEGYLQFTLGELNCGTQLKLSSIITGVLFSFLAYKYIATDEYKCESKVLEILGNNSFGIYFSHLAVMSVLAHVPYYTQYFIFPINALVTIFITLICVIIGKKILGKNAKYLGL